jgi:hypothetical protein
MIFAIIRALGCLLIFLTVVIIAGMIMDSLKDK